MASGVVLAKGLLLSIFVAFFPQTPQVRAAQIVEDLIPRGHEGLQLLPQQIGPAVAVQPANESSAAVMRPSSVIRHLQGAR
jgi:hypothetical protein